MMEVAQGNAEGIAGVRLKVAVQSQEYFHHMLNLDLVSVTFADQGLLHLAGRVLIDG